MAELIIRLVHFSWEGLAGSFVSPRTIRQPVKSELVQCYGRNHSWKKCTIKAAHWRC